MSTFPWRVVTTSDLRLIILDAQDRLVAAVAPDALASPEAIADATLLCSAPVLRDALIRTRENLPVELVNRLGISAALAAAQPPPKSPERTYAEARDHQRAITRWYISQHHPLFRLPERAADLAALVGDGLHDALLECPDVDGTIGQMLPPEGLAAFDSACYDDAHSELLQWEASSAVGIMCRARITYALANEVPVNWEEVVHDLFVYAFS